MSFAVFADGSANLPGNMLGGISLLPCAYVMGGKNEVYSGDLDQFDGQDFYGKLRDGLSVQTSLLNTQLFLQYFTPVLEKGRDIIYVCMSSGISGTYNAARLAAEELMESFRGRFVHIVDHHKNGKRILNLKKNLVKRLQNCQSS